MSGKARQRRIGRAWVLSQIRNEPCSASAVGNLQAAPTFLTLPTASFIVNGAKPASDLAVVTAGAELRLAGGISLMGKFDGEFGRHQHLRRDRSRALYLVKRELNKRRHLRPLLGRTGRVTRSSGHWRVRPRSTPQSLGTAVVPFEREINFRNAIQFPGKMQRQSGAVLDQGEEIRTRLRRRGLSMDKSRGM